MNFVGIVSCTIAKYKQQPNKEKKNVKMFIDDVCVNKQHDGFSARYEFAACCLAEKTTHDLHNQFG